MKSAGLSSNPFTPADTSLALSDLNMSLGILAGDTSKAYYYC